MKSRIHVSSVPQRSRFKSRIRFSLCPHVVVSAQYTEFWLGVYKLRFVVRSPFIFMTSFGENWAYVLMFRRCYVNSICGRCVFVPPSFLSWIFFCSCFFAFRSLFFPCSGFTITCTCVRSARLWRRREMMHWCLRDKKQLVLPSVIFPTFSYQHAMFLRGGDILAGI